MSCRKCRPNQLCRECSLTAQAAQRRREQEAQIATEPMPAPVEPKPEPHEPVGSGVDAGYNYNIGAWRPGFEPRYVQEVKIR